MDWERRELERDGYVMLPGVYSAGEMESLASMLSDKLSSDQHGAVLQSRGRVYGSRNLFEVAPEVRLLLDLPTLKAFITAVLGNEAGIVRGLFFDKPPERSWSLPWHSDRTIAVQRNDLASEQFRHPTSKAGIPHVEAPAWLLDQMLTIRIHVDPMTPDNGPLSVLPGSHHSHNHDQPLGEPVELRAAAGDVLAMRPLLVHSSAMSRPTCSLHRRVLHFELAAVPNLPDEYEWYAFYTL